MSKGRFKANPSDFVIVLMGPKGSGKTNFIKNMTGNVKRHEADRSALNVQDVTPYAILRDDRRRIVLVDTPGFDDTYQPDTTILKMVSDWLKLKYAFRSGILRLTAIVYFHQITDDRIFGTAHKNTQGFSQLCNGMPLPRVHLVTTMWDIVDKNVGERRETGFKREFWREWLEEAATTFRFDNHPCSAQTIIDSLFVPNEFVIAVMGPTGSGKTNFINSVTGNPERRTAHLSSLASDTHAVTLYVIYRDGLHIVLVDTPGFDHTYLSDGEILKIIADWLMQEYSSGGRLLRLAGIIYLHRITDSQMFGSTYRSLQMLSEMCGDAFLPQVHLVTTMWDIVKDKNMAEKREHELKHDFWQVLLDGGATAFRKLLFLQEELVEQKKDLNETMLGNALLSRFQKLLLEQRRTLKELADQAEARNDPALAQSLWEEWDKINVQLQKTFDETKEMKVPVTRRTLLWLSGQRSCAHAINLNIALS